jgi:hypothetical protein
MTTEPRDPLAEVPDLLEYGPDPAARYAGSTTLSHKVPPAAHETLTISTTQTFDAPRLTRSARRLALFGITGMVAVAGGITGIAVTSNHAQAPDAAVPVHRAGAPLAPSGQLLVTITGSGLRYSAPFLVADGPLKVQYSYRCTNGSHPFTAALTASQSNISTFARTTGTGASRIATIRPQKIGTSYRIAADSVCPYQIGVYEPVRSRGQSRAR